MLHKLTWVFTDPWHERFCSVSLLPRLSDASVPATDTLKTHPLKESEEERVRLGCSLFVDEVLRGRL
jgi:hypothetical protein